MPAQPARPTTAHAPPVASLGANRPAVVQLKEALRRARDRATGPQPVAVVTVAKGVLSSIRYRAVEHLLMLGYDAIDRGAPLEDAEEFGHVYIALMRARYAARHAETFDLSRATLSELHVAEQDALGRKEATETAYAYESTARNAAFLIQADAAHRTANERLMEFVRRMSTVSTVDQPLRRVP